MRKIAIPLTCLALLAIAAAVAVLLVKTGPTAEKQRPPGMAALVETVPLRKGDETAVLHLAGTVVPSREVVLRPRVGGEIVHLADGFIEGGLVEGGSEVLRIEPVDYELALAQAESTLERARFELALEHGRQDVARREWGLLKTEDASEQERGLALRIPHLAAAKAALAAAEAAMEKARLDLARTSVAAPFNAIVLERNVNLGAQTSAQSPLGRIAGTDAYWVQASIPVDRIGWIEIPGGKAMVRSAGGAEREGKVLQLQGELEPKGRMARLLVEVADPLCLEPANAGRPPLLLGEYVQVEIQGRRIEGVFGIPREALHDDGRVWIATPAGRLDIRPVEVAWRDARQVLVRNGLEEGELLVVSALAAPVQGMAVSAGQEAKQPGGGRP